ncbi:hypothetical protein Barb6_01975 [Bacteroidales bacterium Barb6]|nr:hypothetical protein Barb6_01975 [Bacteroidales bacterium Barb6]
MDLFEALCADGTRGFFFAVQRVFGGWTAGGTARSGNVPECRPGDVKTAVPARRQDVGSASFCLLFHSPPKSTRFFMVKRVGWTFYLKNMPFKGGGNTSKSIATMLKYS